MPAAAASSISRPVWKRSSWKGSAVFRGTLNGKFEAVLRELKGPADIGFDSKRQRVLVPRFLENAVESYDLK